MRTSWYSIHMRISRYCKLNEGKVHRLIQLHGKKIRWIFLGPLNNEKKRKKKETHAAGANDRNRTEASPVTVLHIPWLTALTHADNYGLLLLYLKFFFHVLQETVSTWWCQYSRRIPGSASQFRSFSTWNPGCYFLFLLLALIICYTVSVVLFMACSFTIFMTSLYSVTLSPTSPGSLPVYVYFEICFRFNEYVSFYLLRTLYV